MLEIYLNQTAELKRALRDEDGDMLTDDRGQGRYSAPVSISCRKRLKTQEIIMPDKQVIKTSWIYTLAEPVQTGDILDDKNVLFVSDKVMVSGETLGYKVML